MDAKTYQLEIITKLADNEKKLSELYAAYGHVFASRKSFWNELAVEEVGHARWIEALKKQVEMGVVLFEGGRFNSDDMHEFYNRVVKEKLKIPKGLPLIKALETAMDIEDSMIEKKFFEVFGGDAPELETLLLALKFSTENHRKVVEDALLEERKIFA